MDHTQRLKRNLDRIRKIQPVDEGLMERRAKAFEGHVASLKTRLVDAVRESLKCEAAQTIATEWARDADVLAKWLEAQGRHASTGEASLDYAGNSFEGQIRVAGLMESLPGLSKLTSWLWRKDRPIAGPTLLVAKELSSQLASDPALNPNEDEVGVHATELAQLLVSNWLGLLESSLERHGQTELVDGFLPATAIPDELVAGCEAFALGLPDCMQVLFAYSRALLADSSKAVDLSPTLQLRPVERGWVLVRPEVPLEKTSTIAELEGSAEYVMERIEGVLVEPLICRPLGWRPEHLPALSMAQATRLALLAVQEEPHSNNLEKIRRMLEVNQARKHLAQQIKADLLHSHLKKFKLMQAPLMCTNALVFHGGEGFDVSSSDVYRVSMLASAAALMGKRCRVAELPVNRVFESDLDEVQNSVLEASIMIATAVTQDPELQKIDWTLEANDRRDDSACVLSY